MLICIACRNGPISAKLCMKSLEEGGVSVLHENLRLKRKERGLSQEELASRLHVVRQTISKWEKGQSVPDAEQLIKKKHPSGSGGFGWRPTAGSAQSMRHSKEAWKPKSAFIPITSKAIQTGDFPPSISIPHQGCGQASDMAISNC